MDKKVYSTGYTIEWKHKRENSINLVVENKITKATKDSTLAEEIHDSGSRFYAGEYSGLNKNSPHIELEKINNSLKSKGTILNDSNKIKKHIELKSGKRIVKGSEKTVNRNSGKPQLHPLALLGFALSLVSLIVMVVTLPFYILSAYGIITTIIVLEFVALEMVPSLLAAALEIIAIIQINDSPSEWNGRGLAIAGIVLAMITLVIGAAILASLLV